MSRIKLKPRHRPATIYRQAKAEETACRTRKKREAKEKPDGSKPRHEGMGVENVEVEGEKLINVYFFALHACCWPCWQTNKVVQ